MTIVKSLFNLHVKIPVFLLLGFALSLGLGACSDDDDDDDGASMTQTIVATAQANSSLSSLVAALTKYPDLVSTLNGSGQYTVFAPTNQAFTTLLRAIDQESIDDIPEDVLRSILEYHFVAGGGVESNDLTNGNVETVLIEDIEVNVSSGVTLNGSVNVTTADVEATNGVEQNFDSAG